MGTSETVEKVYLDSVELGEKLETIRHAAVLLYNGKKRERCFDPELMAAYRHLVAFPEVAKGEAGWFVLGKADVIYLAALDNGLGGTEEPIVGRQHACPRQVGTWPLVTRACDIVPAVNCPIQLIIIECGTRLTKTNQRITLTGGHIGSKTRERATGSDER